MSFLYSDKNGLLANNSYAGCCLFEGGFFDKRNIRKHIYLNMLPGASGEIICGGPSQAKAISKTHAECQVHIHIRAGS